MSSRELKKLKFSFVLRTHEHSDIFDTIDQIFTSKKVNILYIFYDADSILMAGYLQKGNNFNGH